MKKFFDIKKIGFGAGILMALFFCVLAAFMSLDVIDALARDNLDKATYCSFVIPPEFVPGAEKGLFINKNHPMESSSIKYDFYDNGLDVALTNRQKAQLEEAGTTLGVTDETMSLTKEIYQNTMSAAYNKEYGQNVNFAVSSFDKITVDGYPGYKIIATFKAADEETVHQRVYMILSRYRTFTISMQRAEDDDCESFFDECASSIHVH
ncbi:hypothetical protein D6855_07570 [Butyrivibrio sp. CB08]|uniref:hypothetical protein n=1 Tax=Butyrivibrio sp. CB08 TaxID=2364879 RepID=UPI000EA8A461|nr:hypothetical protein [Butyrivibrio sp. CB08]RKM60558.1 hypothetical protein D6855_07570 [Butyrivibrio sp. CB08]